MGPRTGCWIVVLTLAAVVCGFGAVHGEAQQQQPQKETAGGTWEYKVLSGLEVFSPQNQAAAIRALRGDRNAILDSATVRAWCLDGALQELGRQGWEFVGSAGADVFVLKRPFH